MKLAKSHKIIFLITALALCLAMAFGSLAFFNTKAETVSPNLSSYFSGVDTTNMELVNDSVNFTVENEDTISIKNKLAIDDLDFELNFNEDVDKLILVLEYDSYYVNGNKNSDNKFDKQIKSTTLITSGVNSIRVENNVVKVNGIAVNGGENKDSYYKIRTVDRSVAKVSFEVHLASDKTESTISLVYVDQMASDQNHAYKQTFVKDNDGKLTAALPVVAIDSPIFVKTETGYELKAYTYYDETDDYYSLSYKVYSVLNNVSISELYPTVGEDAKITLFTDEEDNNKDKLAFQTGAAGTTQTFNVSYMDGDDEIDVATYNVNVIDVKDTTNSAPKYINDSLALEAYRYQLEKLYTEEKDGKTVDVPLGTEIELPSFEDLIVDDRTPYDKLTKKLYYVSDSKGNSSSLEFKLGIVGDYYFYVLFTDLEGEGMDEEEDFIKVDEDTGDITYGTYGSADNDKFIFYFTIKEDVKIVINAPSSQGAGYKGTKYTASKFDIKAVKCDLVYTLYYNADINADKQTTEGWVEIKQLKDVEEGETVNGYTYDELKKINYNGEYTFTPDKVGTYKIECLASSTLAHRTETESTIIRINEEAKVVKPASNWLQDNVWSVVFLSIGTLCLVGILVLLFIKPKEKTDEEN